MIRILLADIDPALRSAMTLLLEMRLGARIVGESNSMEELLSMVALTRPDVIILDWELPGAPKTDRITALRRVQPSLKIVVSGARPEIARLAQAVHADAFVYKSEPPENLVRAIREL